MVFLTETAVKKLKMLILEHPEDPIVRLMVQDLDDTRLSFNITLEDKVQPDDQVQEIEGLTVAVEGASASRLQGVTLDYHESTGFKFNHPEPEKGHTLNVLNLN